jgi:hypothetical protein
MEISLSSLTHSSSSVTTTGAEVTSSSSLWSKQEQAVMRGLPWITDIAEAQVSNYYHPYNFCIISLIFLYLSVASIAPMPQRRGCSHRIADDASEWSPVNGR